ncbi:AAA family ATPase [Mycobacterium sp. 663a-19]|uniref:ATP-binding protein n=1 Tax=Mycobacterium sp. 663a-19 TaxID=2986148 RepID=UPI002D1F3E2E|nr:adenylate/guanylate cyclase domain-containing protein [Mycobacterium sp. 663a-19]MEB3983374.1 AAA family ATPase [Mycobacterium sp. 663a-19]
MTAIAACRTCGSEPLENARFCHRCGSPLPDGNARAEYKQVTILFADVVHSMDIAAAVGPERLREIITGLVDRCSAVVKRYGGTVDKFTGDGIMAVFGAPMALEDHAIRAGLAALGIQDEAARLAVDVQEHDGVDLRIRVGLNSGQVIAGEIGSGPFGYTAIGEQVGMAQRMESVAPPGGVMLTASTKRLVDDVATLGDPELVRIKGADEPVVAYRLLGLGDGHRVVGHGESSLVGRRCELSTVEALLERAIDGHGGVVSVVGSPGIGKSRLVREVAAMAAVRGVEVFTTFCESHAADVPFRVVARLLRAATGIEGVEAEAARAQVHAQVRGADPEDLALFDDLLGIADPEFFLPKTDADARRRRLTALVNAASLARTTPTLYVIEDAHWIDAVSESMLADFLEVIPRTRSLVLISYRPEYRGALSRVPGAQGITLAPLSDAETAALVAELLGPDPSVAEIGQIITARAAGNPFFAEEITRELAQRGVLVGERANYSCRTDVTDVQVPATLQAAIAARIDRLPPAAKRTLAAAAVIGSSFSCDLLASLGIDARVDELITAELIKQVRHGPDAEYAFHHPLIRTVAYEAQLKSDRAESHRRLAAAIETREPQSADQNAALIADHLQAAGDLRDAYGWNMRAAKWATNRDIAAARFRWERARMLADALPAGEPDRAAMRIAPRTMLCAIAWRVHEHVAGARFEEMRELCGAAGDKASLAIATAGLGHDCLYQGRILEASRLASEAWELIEALDNPVLTVGLSPLPIRAKTATSEWSTVLRWSQRAIDLAEGDPSKGNFMIGCPLANALAVRGIARCSLGLPGWRDDQRQAIAMARHADPLSYTGVIAYVYFPGILSGMLLPEDSAMREIEDAVRIAERSGDDVALAFARMTLSVALVHRHTAAERERGNELLATVSEMYRSRGQNVGLLPAINVCRAREMVRRGDRDEAIPLMRAAVDDLFRDGVLQALGSLATGVLMETLLDRGADGDMAEAEAAVEQLAAARGEDGLVTREIWLLRCRAGLARAHGDDAGYREYRDRYRDMAKRLGFEGHIGWAEAMP